MRRNREVQNRNKRRVQSANILLSKSNSNSMTSADTLVQAKLSSARELGKSGIVSAQTAIYMSAIREEMEMRDKKMATEELEDFDEVLEKRGGR